MLNYGLAAASLAGAVSLAWLLGSLFAAQTSLTAARDRGAAARSLVQAEIAVLRAHADESLTLINRSGDDASEADAASASHGDRALSGLATGMFAASLLMAAVCAWGLAQRITEYR